MYCTKEGEKKLFFHYLYDIIIYSIFFKSKPSMYYLLFLNDCVVPTYNDWRVFTINTETKYENNE